MKIGFVSLGCPRAVADFEAGLGTLISGSHRIVQDPLEADAVIINTCGFIEEAKRESIEAISQLCELKHKNKIRLLVVMGCLSQRYGATLQKKMPEIDAVLGTDQYEELNAVLDRISRHERVIQVIARPQYLVSDKSPRYNLTPPGASYLKISEGCLNACAYCAIPKMRGVHRSRSLTSVLSEFAKLSKERGSSEICLIGQDVAAYGYDRKRQFELPRLLDALAGLKLPSWIRLLYLHPAHVTKSLVEAMARHRKICRYADLPIEHIHDDVLKRMNRRVTRDEIIKTIELFRRRIPKIALRTSVMVGFPGETEKEFKALLDFIRDYRPEHLGAFMFSREEGTAAYRMKKQIPRRVKEERYHEVMALGLSQSRERLKGFVGEHLTVLIDKLVRKGLYVGRTEFDAPEIDGAVYLKSNRLWAVGDFVDAVVTRSSDYDLHGAV